MDDKKRTYDTVVAQVQCLVDGVTNHVGALANITALLKEAFPYYFWVGFYLVKDDQLELGPFQGPVACYTIGKGRGVCGTSWAQVQTLIVPNVEQFPGHIACSSRSRSEIVVPILRNGNVVGVIDVDSEQLNSFDTIDQEGLERIATLCEPLV